MAERRVTFDRVYGGQRFTIEHVTYETVRRVRGFNRRCHNTRALYRIDGRPISKAAWLAIVDSHKG